MTIDEIIDDVEYYITNPEKWTNYSTKRRSELRMMIEDLISQNSGKPIVSGSLPLPTEAEASAYANGAFGYESSADDKEYGFMSGYEWTVGWICSKSGGNDR